MKSLLKAKLAIDLIILAHQYQQVIYVKLNEKNLYLKPGLTQLKMNKWKMKILKILIKILNIQLKRCNSIVKKIEKKSPIKEKIHSPHEICIEMTLLERLKT